MVVQNVTSSFRVYYFLWLIEDEVPLTESTYVQSDMRRNSSTFADASWNALVVENRILLPARKNDISTWYFTGSEVRFKELVGTRVTYEERFARYEIHSA